MPDAPEDPGRRLVRREPPTFLRVEVLRTEDVSPRLRRITLGGTDLAPLPAGLPAASVRVLLPRAGALELPAWNGNEFLHHDGARPAIRTLTPRRTTLDGTGATTELDVEVVLHDDGVLSSWASAAAPGAVVAVSGTGRGYEADPVATSFLLAGDETALPAISVLLEALPAAVAIDVIVEVARPDARFELPTHPGASVTWLDLPTGSTPGAVFVPAVEALTLPEDVRVWAAGEAAAVQRLRRHLFEDRSLTRTQAVVRGYWKHGRRGDTEG